MRCSRLVPIASVFHRLAPFENVYRAAQWLDLAAISENDRIRIGGTNAAQLSKSESRSRGAGLIGRPVLQSCYTSQRENGSTANSPLARRTCRLQAGPRLIASDGACSSARSHQRINRLLGMFLSDILLRCTFLSLPEWERYAWLTRLPGFPRHGGRFQIKSRLAAQRTPRRKQPAARKRQGHARRERSY
jgi:hypothetical protein